MQQFDIILVVGFFRRLTSYLSIIKYLVKDKKIGLFPIPLEGSLKSKHKSTQEEFIRTCVDMGGQVIANGTASAKIAIFPQEPYLKEAFERIHENLMASRKIGMLTLAWVGIHDAFIEELDINKVFVVHRAFFDFLLRHRGDPKIFEKREIVEVGLPYKKYPIFQDFQADYLMAIPTPFSFSREKDKWDFLETVLSLFQKIDHRETIVYKPHNAQDRDYFSDFKYRRLAHYLRLLPDKMVRLSLKGLAGGGSTSAGNRFGRLYSAFLYERIMDRVIPIENLTAHHHLAMEAFLPGVNKGIIGGLSNTMWGALFFELPFYNCVDIEVQDREREDKLYNKDSSQLLDLNLRFFHVPYCRGELEFDRKYFDIVDDSTRQGDLIYEIKKELSQV